MDELTQAQFFDQAIGYVLFNGGLSFLIASAMRRGLARVGGHTSISSREFLIFGLIIPTCFACFPFLIIAVVSYIYGIPQPSTDGSSQRIFGLTTRTLHGMMGVSLAGSISNLIVWFAINIESEWDKMVREAEKKRKRTRHCNTCVCEIEKGQLGQGATPPEELHGKYHRFVWRVVKAGVSSERERVVFHDHEDLERRNELVRSRPFAFVV
ncbi:uncharacterized protein LTR77_000621 [Saxophila tyrrhenica]|uniref:Uncharacterized protein n=1 Tax=Saxophila tyrrhenica TaxID=1690608 RepID=A0AAV9PRP9_9PEZI|nr:hypothetical protein LTR77_000621 [Saxophila tyrrhenica]